jgi:hypothetical protein
MHHNHANCFFSSSPSIFFPCFFSPHTVWTLRSCTPRSDSVYALQQQHMFVLTMQKSGIRPAPRPLPPCMQAHNPHNFHILCYHPHFFRQPRLPSLTNAPPAMFHTPRYLSFFAFSPRSQVSAQRTFYSLRYA